MISDTKTHYSLPLIHMYKHHYNMTGKDIQQFQYNIKYQSINAGDINVEVVIDVCFCILDIFKYISILPKSY